MTGSFEYLFLDRLIYIFLERCFFGSNFCELIAVSRSGRLTGGVKTQIVCVWIVVPVSVLGNGFNQIPSMDTWLAENRDRRIRFPLILRTRQHRFSEHIKRFIPRFIIFIIIYHCPWVILCAIRSRWLFDRQRHHQPRLHRQRTCYNSKYNNSNNRKCNNRHWNGESTLCSRAHSPHCPILTITTRRTKRILIWSGIHNKVMQLLVAQQQQQQQQRAEARERRSNHRSHIRTRRSLATACGTFGEFLGLDKRTFDWTVPINWRLTLHFPSKFSFTSNRIQLEYAEKSKKLIDCLCHTHVKMPCVKHKPVSDKRHCHNEPCFTSHTTQPVIRSDIPFLRAEKFAIFRLSMVLLVLGGSSLCHPLTPPRLREPRETQQHLSILRVPPSTTKSHRHQHHWHH